MPDYKLLGHNYTTPDLIANVTGRAKYAEDYRTDGMSFCDVRRFATADEMPSGAQYSER
jgi:hypothetical protein